MTWSDEFNGTSFRPQFMEIGNRTNGWGNEEFQIIQKEKNIEFENGCLVIIPRMEYDLVAKEPVYCSSTKLILKVKREFASW